MKHIKIKTLLEDNHKKFADEVVKLSTDADKLLTDLIRVIDNLQLKANSGVWYYSGNMSNPYGITQDEDMQNLFDELKEEVKGNLLFNLRNEDKKYLESVKSIIKKIVNKTPKEK